MAEAVFLTLKMCILVSVACFVFNSTGQRSMSGHALLKAERRVEEIHRGLWRTLRPASVQVEKMVLEAGPVGQTAHHMAQTTTLHHQTAP